MPVIPVARRLYHRRTSEKTKPSNRPPVWRRECEKYFSARHRRLSLAPSPPPRPSAAHFGSQKKARFAANRSMLFPAFHFLAPLRAKGEANRESLVVLVKTTL